MSTKSAKLSILTLFLIAVGLSGCRQVGENTAQAAPAQEQAVPEAQSPEPEAEAPAPMPEATAPNPDSDGFREIASYGIPDASPPAVRRLVSALGDDPGLISAEVNEEQSQLEVTFTVGLTDPHTILAALTTVEPRVSFVGVRHDTSTGEPPPGHNCGGCPRRNQCQHGH